MMSQARSLWERATRVIPGGVSLLSKHPDRHAPGTWPTYFSHARGCRIVSLDGDEYVDMGLMGIGTNVLGYAYDPVDEAVHRAIRQGVSSTLNCPEEVLLAERLVDLHPWAQAVRFARSGGEANALAVRIARAASGREEVAVCGYHGWHDWYLAGNLGDTSSLDGHVMPGLEPVGVPNALRGTTHPFHYNDVTALERILATHAIAAIVMEVERAVPPHPGFLQEVRRLATLNGAVLIFDECTSGFRTTLGGHHLTHGVNPDIAVFGKALGNGYAISAVVGSEEVMCAARDAFISSTFWTERIGPTAALATLDAMESLEAPKRINAIGTRYRTQLHEALGPLASEVVFTGLPALTSLDLPGLTPRVGWPQDLSNHFLSLSYLAGTKFYASLAHEDELDPFVELMAAKLSQLLCEDYQEDAGMEQALGDFYRLA